MCNQHIKMHIKRLYSAELECDATVAAAMERQQLRKWLLTWANDDMDNTMQTIQLDNKKQHWYHQE